MVAGYFVNGDVPTPLSLLATGLLIVALFVRPENGNAREQSSVKPHALRIAILIMLAFVALQAIKDPLYREYVRNIPNIFFGIAFYMTVLMALMNLFFLFKRPEVDEFPANSDRKRILLGVSIPVLWFLGTVPEALSFREFPVYVMISLMAVSFVMAIVSDFLYGRIRFGFRTALFALLIFTSIGVNVYAHFA